MSPRRFAESMRRYGLITVRFQGRSIYREALEQLKRIEKNYGVDLNTEGRPSGNVLTVMRY